MMPRILLVNPPIYDFSAYDFWMKPYGLLSVAGRLRGKARFHLFDYLDRSRGPASDTRNLRADEWGRGAFHAEEGRKPEALSDIPRRYRRYGLPRDGFVNAIRREGPFDFVLIGTGMTYWYLGVKEVIEDIRRSNPRAKIVLGGIYATICPDHARSLGGDVVIEGDSLDRLWLCLGLEPAEGHVPLWEAYDRLETGVIKLSNGCPFRCSYCAVPQTQPRFAPARWKR